MEQGITTLNNFHKICSVSDVDFMEGHIFEYFCAYILEKNGYENVSVTKGSGDQGVDVLAQKNGIRYAIQCKNYASSLSNTPIQEVFAGKTYYNCHVGVVMTNSTFTPSGITLAQSTGILIWDRTELQKMISTANPKQPVKAVVKLKHNKINNNNNYQQNKIEPQRVNNIRAKNSIASNSRLRKGMKTWAIICFVLALLYVWTAIVIEPSTIAGTVFFGILGIMFFILALSTKEDEFLLGRGKGIKKTSFIWICVGVAFLLFGVIASLLQQH